MSLLITQLRQLKLTGMAEALSQQLAQPGVHQDLAFEDRLGHLVARELDSRDTRALGRRLKAAKLKLAASLDAIDFSHPRGLQRSGLLALAHGDWLARGLNLVIAGPTGCGKTYLACALGQHACLRGYSVRYFRAGRLFEQLSCAHGDGSFPRLMLQLAKTDLLILDDFGLDALNAQQRSDFLELMEDRHGKRSTLVASQLPVQHWHASIGDATLADAILDRLVHNAYKLNLKGESLRKRQGAELALAPALTSNDEMI